jgi:asparagine synthase (glutamine-hydrolysing)
MQIVLGAVGVTPERVDRLRVAAEQVASGGLRTLLDRDGSWLVRSDEASTVIGDAVRGTRALGLVGSAAYRHRDRTAEALSAPHAFAGVQELGVLAIDSTHGWMVATAGPGNQSLFVAEAPEGGTVVGSNLGVVAAAVGVAGELDRSAEDFLLGFGFLPDDRTVHPGVRVLRSTTLVVGPAPSADTPQPLPTPVPEVSSFDQAVDVLFDLHMGAVEEQAAGSTSHAVLLGGFDSALVTASLRRLGHDVSTYTFGFGDRTYEQRNVDVVTRTLGSEEHWVRITPETIGEGLTRFGDVFSQPGPQPHYQIHTLEASRRIRSDGFDHVFTGDGCDAVFLGYPMVNTRARLVATLGRAPRPLAQAALRSLSTPVADRHLGHVARMARSTLGNVVLGGAAAGHLPTRYLDDVALRRLRTGAPPAQDESVEQIRRRLAAAVSDLDRTRLAFHGNSLTGQSRVKVMGAVGGTGVAQSTPFTHPSVASFVASLPLEYLRPSGSSAGSSGKALLIEMARRHRLLPDEVIDMPKQSPVDSPIDRWYAGELRGDVLGLLDQLPFEWDRQYVEEILRPRPIEDLYRTKVSIGHHAFQAVGLLASYASFAGT